MPEFMPYTTEKAMVFQVTESWANGNRATAVEALHFLASDGRISDMWPIGSPTLDGLTGTSAAWRRRHVEEHWWGKRHNAAGGYDPQRSYDPVNNPTTGFWAHWYGNAEGIFRETMIRALCVSLGVKRHQAKNGSGDGRHWPISIIWKCPSPWYEGWIEFKDYSRGLTAGDSGLDPDTGREGHVTVVLSTPSHGVKLYDTPIRPTNLPPVSNDPFNTYELNPNEPAGPEGLWVVSQAAHAQIASAPSTKTEAGTWGPPVLGTPVYSAGPVVTVATAIGDGGVAPPGLL